MASTIVSLPPSHSPLPPSPPRSPSKDGMVTLSSDPNIDHLGTMPGPETPARSPFTSDSFATSTTGSLDGAASTARKMRASSASETAPAFTGHRYKPTPKSAGVKLEDFELIRVLGKGCAGRVLLVKQTTTSSILAMKAISKRSVLTHDELDHTLAELRILKRFAIDEPDNPFIARLSNSFTDRENFYFVMDFYPGGDLATQMEIHGILGHHRTRFYAADVVQGLEDLHRHGIIVRDLKPENILLNARGHAVLADFGLSKEFGYRGDPHPLHVATYPGQDPLPEWAGQGAGSLRMNAEGSKRLVVDRAYSFVGTSEYLSPEVVKRGEYSYAVDWWALGCIVLEGMMGRVPFRKDEEEPPIVLWNKILYEPWDDIFKDPKLAKRPPSAYGLDPTTWHFIDSLLIKDPMWRLTEPFVKAHGYFQFIDWETVRRGEYEDPHDLDLHPITEYNTHYFPKLCLDEEPTVDMASHDSRFMEENECTKTPLNDNALYMLEQAKYKAELDGFTWSRDDESFGKVLVVEEGSHEVNGVEVDEAEEVAEEDGEVDMPSTHIEVERPTPELVEDELPDTEDKARSVYEDVEEVEVVSPELPSVPTMPIETVLDEKRASAHSPGALDLENTEDATTIETMPSPEDSKSTTPLPRAPEMVERDHGLPAMPSQRVEAAHVASSPRPIPSTNGNAQRQSTRDRPELALPNTLPAGGLSVSDMVSIPSPGLGSPSRIIRRHRPLPSVDTLPISRLSVELHGTITHLGDEDWEQLDPAEGTQLIPTAPNGVPVGPGAFFNRVLRRRPSTLYTSGLRRQAKTSDSSSKESSPTKIRPPPNMTLPSPGSGLFGSKSKGSTKKAFEKIKAFPKLRKSSTTMDRPPAEKSSRTRSTSSSINGKLPKLDLTQPPVIAMPAGLISLSTSSVNEVSSANETNAVSYSSKVGDEDILNRESRRPNTVRRHTESGWFDKKPKLRKRASASAAPGGGGGGSTGGLSAAFLSQLSRSGSRSASMKGKMSRSVTETFARGKNTSSEEEEEKREGRRVGAPRVELRKTPPILWELERA